MLKKKVGNNGNILADPGIVDLRKKKTEIAAVE